ncbi:hypothetical protein GCM10009133_14910 [Cocleimonas flava]|uniref:Uncharacterized protein DUF3305 n=1 Tax=Cocleimonas flava TaxID=634765 RepID=A0A4R1F5J0_9GAMM|nr:DUF3305 domain-containing protein [Cocleimonas flava]TCJ87859.1 uncharacterized protein DUF3305 [Cocleimonas flava]
MNKSDTSTNNKPENSQADISTTDSEKLKNSFTVSVIMESRPSQNKWIDEVWDAVGIVALSEQDVDAGESSEAKDQIKVVEQGEVKQLIYSGMKIRLYNDECESYYHNLMSPEPGCFIIAREEDAEGNDTGIPIPFLVSLSFDEAHAYLEGEATIYAVPIPPELYRWAEAYVVENYVAEKRIKRKRTDWKVDSREGQQPGKQQDKSGN